jgi:hypothetical protein
MLYHSLDRLVTVAGGVGTEPSSIFSTSALTRPVSARTASVAAWA